MSIWLACGQTRPTGEKHRTAIERAVIVSHPTPTVLDNLLAVVDLRACPIETGLDLRVSSWATLLHLRRAHGSLAAALEAARDREAKRPATGKKP